MNNKRGKLIVFEGGEGSGKTTISGMVYEWFRDHQIPVIKSREPGGVKIAEEIRKIVLDNEMDALTELFLYEAARREHYLKVIKPALEDGKVVILDRFIDSTAAIQGHVRGVNITLVDLLNRKSTNNEVIDLVIVLNIEPEVALKRIKENNRETNRFDNYDLDFHNAVNEALQFECETNTHNHVLIDVNDLSIDETFSKVIEVIQDAKLDK